MTNELDRTIVELQAELRNADPDERRQIEAELALALAEREVFVAEQEGRVSAEPPFEDGFCHVAWPDAPDRPARRARSFASPSTIA